MCACVCCYARIFYSVKWSSNRSTYIVGLLYYSLCVCVRVCISVCMYERVCARVYVAMPAVRCQVF